MCPPLSLQGIPPSDLDFGISRVLAEGKEAVGGGSKEYWGWNFQCLFKITIVLKFQKGRFLMHFFKEFL